jgi:lipopolysaccharide biosynthesis glycosyltransferase
MIHICFNLDEKYLNYCKVLIKEIEAKTSEMCTFHFIGITKRDMGCKGKSVFYPNPDLSYFKSETLVDYLYFSKAALYRLLIPFLIKVDKVLYLDIDIVVLKDLKLLWDKEVDLVGAVPDGFSICFKKRLNLNTEYYYNSGVILFNSKKIREEMPDYKEQILQVQKNYTLEYKDQDIFNIIFLNRITFLGYEFNLCLSSCNEKGEPKEVSYAKDKAFNAPVIVHCIGMLKWWDVEGYPYGRYFDQYAKNLIDIKHRQKVLVSCTLFEIIY